ncbi:hypothetical protein Dimus_020537 [Dionaea muscipula]
MAEHGVTLTSHHHQLVTVVDITKTLSSMLRMKRSRARQQRQKPKAKLRLSTELDTLPSMRRPTPSSAHQPAETIKAKHGGRRRSPHRRAPLVHAQAELKKERPTSCTTKEAELTFSMHEGRAPHLSTMSSPSPAPSPRSGQGPSLAPNRYQAEGRAPSLDDELIFIVSMYHRRAQASSRTQGKTDLRPCMVSVAELSSPSMKEAKQGEHGVLAMEVEPKAYGRSHDRPVAELPSTLSSPSTRSIQNIRPGSGSSQPWHTTELRS